MSARALNLDLALYEKQEDFVFSEAKFPAFVGGVGSGKTHALVIRAIVGKLQYPYLDRGYFAPTWDLINLIAWERFEVICEQHHIKIRLSKQDRVIYFETGGKIIFRTLENPDRIIGFEIADADIDELDTLPQVKASLAWNKVVARCRQVKRDGKLNTASIGTTPEGFRFVYERWHNKKSDLYVMYKAKTQDAYLLPAGYIEAMQETFPAQLLAAYLDGEFVNMQTGSVYPEFDRFANGSDEVIQPNEPLHVGCDFNITNMSAVVSVLRKELPHVVAEHLKMRDTETMARFLVEKYPGHSICVYPDATGGQRQHASVGVSDIAILAGKGLTVCTERTNGPVRDRVNAVNAMILNAKGERRLKVNVAQCPVVTENLEKQAYDSNGEPDKGGAGRDHTNDALGYYLNHIWPVNRKAMGRWNIGFAH